ncbi:MAG TPA: hypothetical protein VJP79_02190 [Nitrososphaera sp.]|nr:hypothetical protein [Nitrososphaera sp.]
MYATLSRPFVDKTLKKVNQEAIKEFSGEENPERDFYHYDLKDHEIKISIEDDELNVSVENELGSFYFSRKLTTDDMVNVIENAVKKANKIKTILEASQ